MSSFAQRWKRKVSSGGVKPKVAECTFSELTGLFKRLPREAWIQAGLLPYFLVNAYNQSVLKEQAKETGEHVEVEEQKPQTQEEFEMDLSASRALVCAVAVDPKIVTHEAVAEDEISYSELALEDPEAIRLIISWVLNGSPEIPAGVVDGMEVKVADLESFRGHTERESISGPRAAMPNVRKKPRTPARGK